MTVPDIGLASVLSDTMGVTARGIMAQAASEEGFDEEKCPRPVRGSARKKADRTVASAKDSKVRPDQLFKIRQSLAHMDMPGTMVAQCELELYIRTGPHWDAAGLLCELPGVSELSAMIMPSEIGFDTGVFDDADQPRGWSGLVPADNTPDGKKKPYRITRAGQYLWASHGLVRPRRRGVWPEHLLRRPSTAG